jgi:hypothetical protein
VAVQQIFKSPLTKIRLMDFGFGLFWSVTEVCRLFLSLGERNKAASVPRLKQRWRAARPRAAIS